MEDIKLDSTERQITRDFSILDKKKKEGSVSKNWLVPLGIALFCLLIIFVLSKAKIINKLEHVTYDWRVSWRNKKIFRSIQAPTHYRNPNIVVVPVDNKTLEFIEDPMLFWTPYYAKVFKYLIKNGARVIALDYLFTISSDKYLKSQMQKFIDKMAKEKKIKITEDEIEGFLPNYDLLLFNVLRTHKIILISTLMENGQVIVPYRAFRFAARDENIALASVQPDDDGVIRRQFLYKTALTPQKNKEEFFSLDLVTASKFLGKAIGHNIKDGKITLGESVIPHDKNFDILINYISKPNTFTKEYSFIQLLNKANEGDNDFFRKNFNNKAVLIGPGNTGSTDIAITPYHSSKCLEMFGIEVHANLLNTLLNSDFINRVPFRVSVGILFFLSLISVFLSYYMKPVSSVSLLLCMGIMFIGISFFLFYRYNLWIGMAAPLIVIPLGYGTTYVYRYIVEDKEKRYIRKVLDRYVSEPVAREILEDPSNLSLGGKRADVSILFCDINDFTTYSEKTPPEEVIHILNDYFTRMEEVIFRNRGTLKQFIGDEIMVVCGVPQKDPIHAQRVCTIAIEMLEELRLWQKERSIKGEIIFDVKFGIHSGEVVSGNVGSPHRTEYTTIGDVVNTTSRIMGLTKQTGENILISEETYNRVKDIFVVEYKGSYPVKGREEEVKVYGLLGKKDKK